MSTEPVCPDCGAPKAPQGNLVGSIHFTCGRHRFDDGTYSSGGAYDCNRNFHAQRSEWGKRIQAELDALKLDHVASKKRLRAPEPQLEGHRPGFDRLWNWFGLGRCAWIIMPRVFAHAMPEDWQWRFAELMEEWDDAWHWPEAVGHAEVSLKVGAHYIALPEWITNYRHPDRDKIESMRAAPAAVIRPPE